MNQRSRAENLEIATKKKVNKEFVESNERMLLPLVLSMSWKKFRIGKKFLRFAFVVQLLLLSQLVSVLSVE